MINLAPKVVFDVGANNGNDTIPLAKNNKNITVYAFEPTPELFSLLCEKTKDTPNYKITNKAVSNYNGKSTFYISGKADWGCSSLNQFNDNLDKTWSGRTDFCVTDTIEVDVITLKNFIIDNNIDTIDYLHVDAQGNDLEVLYGLEEYIKIVKEGVIEMPICHDTKLYKNQKYLLSDAILFLTQNNFKIISIKPNDIHGNEFNIYFTSKFI